MNFIRSRLSLGSLLGQRRQVTQIWSHRRMCDKLQEPKAPAQELRRAFKVADYRPSEMDKKILIWSGRFKTVDQIPETVSFEMINAARNKVRVKAAYLMMAMTIGACILMIFFGQRALDRNETVTALNMEKKAKLKKEFQKEQEDSALSDKAQ